MKHLSHDEWLEIIKSAYCEGTLCHGCSGKGWVAPSYGVAAICPVCGGSGVANEKYVVKHGANSTKIKGEGAL